MMMTFSHHLDIHPFALMTVLVMVSVMGACSDKSSPDRSSHGGGAGGSVDAAGGLAGFAGEENAGSAGIPYEPYEPPVKLPEGCVPDDMPFVCNPMTNEGCDGVKGEACDYGLDEVFTCFERLNNVPKGGACNWETGPYCEVGLTCDVEDPEDSSGTCKPHCCGSGDCEPGQTCVPVDPEFGTVGICQ
jgi:hypothetical protein